MVLVELEALFRWILETSPSMITHVVEVEDVVVVNNEAEVKEAKPEVEHSPIHLGEVEEMDKVEANPSGEVRTKTEDVEISPKGTNHTEEINIKNSAWK